jgi:LmbE family N-acetylglucosaminyl deacetylase
MPDIPNEELQGKLSILFVGAHPDDADIQFGGTAIRYLQLGHTVNYLTATNGNAGHQTLGGAALAQRRYKETQTVANYLGINYFVLDNEDGELQATIENRKKVIKVIREVRPHLIVTHRPNDYHADHRNASLLVQDAAYLLCVPNVLPLTPRLEFNPVIVYHQDNFTKPAPFTPEVIVDITEVIDKKMEALSLHESQVFEWIPFIEGYLGEVPTDKSERVSWLKTRWAQRTLASRFLTQVKPGISSEALINAQFLEAFERCEYGSRLTHENVDKLFPFGVVNF